MEIEFWVSRPQGVQLSPRSWERGDEAIFAPISNFLSELKKRKTTVVLQETSKSRDVLHAESF